MGIYIYISEMIQKFGTAANQYNQSHPPFIFTHGFRRVPVVASSHRGDRGDYGNGGTPTCLSWKIPWQWMIHGYPYFRKPPDVVCCNNIDSERLSSTGLICPKKMDISDGKDGWQLMKSRGNSSRCGYPTGPFFFQRRAALRGSSLGYPVRLGPLCPSERFQKIHVMNTFSKTSLGSMGYQWISNGIFHQSLAPSGGHCESEKDLPPARGFSAVALESVSEHQPLKTNRRLAAIVFSKGSGSWEQSMSSLGWFTGNLVVK